jgi:hypothetical protein
MHIYGLRKERQGIQIGYASGILPIQNFSSGFKTDWASLLRHYFPSEFRIDNSEQRENESKERYYKWKRRLSEGVTRSLSDGCICMSYHQIGSILYFGLCILMVGQALYHLIF